MATQHKTVAHAEATETKQQTTPALNEPENPVKSPEVKPLKPPDTGTWQSAFWEIANDLDNTGNHWLGRMFREQSQV
jgi:hypothetical protein